MLVGRFALDAGALAGDMGLEGGLSGVEVPEGWVESRNFFCFLCEVSVPLASERFGDPGRLSVLDAGFCKWECLV